MTKFCKDCIFSTLSYESRFTKRECTHTDNLGNISLVTGEFLYKYASDWLRSDAGYCGADGLWFEQKALPRGYETLGYDPDARVEPGETLQERMERLREKVRSNKNKSLKSLTLDDLI